MYMYTVYVFGISTTKLLLTVSVNLYLQSVAPFYSSFLIFNPMVTNRRLLLQFHDCPQDGNCLSNTSENDFTKYAVAIGFHHF